MNPKLTHPLSAKGSPREWNGKESVKFHEYPISSRTIKVKFQALNPKEKSKAFIEKIIEAKNVLNEVIATISKVSEQMIAEINRCARENQSLVREIKTKIKSTAISNNTKPIQETIDWAKSLNLKTRDKKSFISSTHRLLSIKEPTIFEINEIEAIKIENKKNKEYIELISYEISRLSNQLDEKNQEIFTLNKENCTLIEQFNESLEKTSGKIEKLKKKIMKKDKEIINLRYENSLIEKKSKEYFDQASLTIAMLKEMQEKEKALASDKIEKKEEDVGILGNDTEKKEEKIKKKKEKRDWKGKMYI